MKQNDKIVIGITGGSGTGKSYLCSLLSKKGYDVIDADVIARMVMEKGEECLLETVREFGEEIIEDGVLNRKRLAKIVFSHKEKLEKLNKITHKYILQKIDEMIEKSKSEIVFVDGAVLIESGFVCDKMIGVLADYDLRVERIMARDNLTEEEAKRRIDAQKNQEFYHENCDFVVYNSGEFDVEGILKRIEE